MPIDFNKYPLKLFRQSRDLAWDPRDIDCAADKPDWANLDPVETQLMLGTVAGFLVGERGVTHDLAPLQQALRREKGRMEEEMYLTMQLMEEAKHVEFFQMWMNDALPGVPGVDLPLPPARGNVFSEVLPQTFAVLLEDRSPLAQMKASCLYHMIVEGVLAETGYKIFHAAFEKRDWFRGLKEGIRQIQLDEARHIAFGTYFLQRLIRENPSLGPAFEEEMERLRPAGESIVDQVFEVYGADGRVVPFGLEEGPLRKFNRQLWESRLQQVKKGRLADG